MNTRTYTYMATKTITITEDAYEQLASLKGPNESFSDAIKKLTRRHSLKEIIGTLTEREACELETAVKKTRKRLRKQLDDLRL